MIRVDGYTGMTTNQAREAVIEYFDKYELEDTGMYKPDHFLAWLWVEGYKITKLEEYDIQES